MGRHVPVSVIWKNKNFKVKELWEYMQGSFWDNENIVSEKMYKVQMSYMGNLPIHCILDIISYNLSLTNEYDKGFRVWNIGVKQVCQTYG